MADADTIWTAVKTAFAVDLLIPLTNIMDRSVNAIDDTVGTNAAQRGLDYWEMYSEVVFDVASTTHVTVAVRATMAILLEAGGVSSEMAQLEWDEVFGANGLLLKLKNVTARGRQGPATNAPDTDSSGQTVKGWSESYPRGTVPRRRNVTTEDW